MGASTINQALAATLRGRAEWRYSKADEYPEDARNERWARAIERAAAYVETLPATDPRLLTIAAAGWPEGDDFVVLGEEGSRFASRCDTGPDTFLSELAEVMADAEVRDFSSDIDSALDDD